MNSTVDRPPLLRFLLMFAALLAGATGLAALSHSNGIAVDPPATATEARLTATSSADRPRPADRTSADAHDAHDQP